MGPAIKRFGQVKEEYYTGFFVISLKVDGIKGIGGMGHKISNEETVLNFNNVLVVRRRTSFSWTIRLGILAKVVGVYGIIFWYTIQRFLLRGGIMVKIFN